MIDEKKLIEEMKNMALPLTISDIRAWSDGTTQAYNEALVDVLTAIEEQPKVGEWIPVEERLPDIYKNVQVTYFGYEDNKLYSDGVAYIDDCGVWRWEFDESKVECGITAWMPLPEPYVKY